MMWRLVSHALWIHGHCRDIIPPECHHTPVPLPKMARPVLQWWVSSVTSRCDSQCDKATFQKRFCSLQNMFIKSKSWASIWQVYWAWDTNLHIITQIFGSNLLKLFFFFRCFKYWKRPISQRVQRPLSLIKKKKQSRCTNSTTMKEHGPIGSPRGQLGKRS